MLLQQVAALKQLTQQDLIDFFDEHVKVGAPRKRTLSVRVYGKLHSCEYASDKSQQLPPNAVPIEDIFSFRRSQPLYGSFKGGFGHMKL
jgi:insulysin